MPKKPKVYYMKLDGSDEDMEMIVEAMKDMVAELQNRAKKKGE